MIAQIFWKQKNLRRFEENYHYLEITTINVEMNISSDIFIYGKER
jgi:hypothetical protein